MMKPPSFPTILRLLLGAAAVVFILSRLDGNPIPVDVLERLIFVLLVLMVATTHVLGLEMGTGRVTFLPGVAILSLLIGGESSALVMITLGLLGGVLIRTLALSRQHRTIALLEDGAVELVQATVSTYGAGLAASALSGWAVPPLTVIADVRDVLPVVACAVIYLLATNAIGIANLLLNRVAVGRTLLENLETLLAVQILPMPFAALTALSFSALSPWSFFILVVALFTIILAIYRLWQTRRSLTRQVSQLTAFSTMNRALRASLEMNALLENVYLQVNRLLRVRNLRVVLRRTAGSDQMVNPWFVAFSVENGRHAPSGGEAPLDALSRRLLDERLPLVVKSVDDSFVICPAASAVGWVCRCSRQTGCWASSLRGSERMTLPDGASGMKTWSHSPRSGCRPVSHWRTPCSTAKSSVTRRG